MLADFPYGLSAGSGHNLDLNLWVSPPQNGPKGNINVKDLCFHSAPYQLPDGKRPRVNASCNNTHSSTLLIWYFRSPLFAVDMDIATPTKFLVIKYVSTLLSLWDIFQYIYDQNLSSFVVVKILVIILMLFCYLQVDSSAPVNGLTMPSEYIPIWPAKYPGFTPNYEEVIIY